METKLKACNVPHDVQTKTTMTVSSNDLSYVKGKR